MSIYFYFFLFFCIDIVLLFPVFELLKISWGVEIVMQILYIIVHGVS